LHHKYASGIQGCLCNIQAKGIPRQSDDKKVLTGLLEDDWPVVYTKLTKPLGLLIPQLVDGMEKDFAVSKVRGERANMLALAAFGLSVVVC
jgi:hypothetical protein